MFSVQCKKEGAHSDSIWSCDWGRVSVGDEPGTNPPVPNPPYNALGMHLLCSVTGAVPY
jgi:hypothetical protein